MIDKLQEIYGRKFSSRLPIFQNEWVSVLVIYFAYSKSQLLTYLDIVTKENRYRFKETSKLYKKIPTVGKFWNENIIF